MIIMVPFFFLLTSSIWLPFGYIRLQARRLSIWCRRFYSATRFWFLASSKELETCRSQVWNFQTRHSAVGDRKQEARSQCNKIRLLIEKLCSFKCTTLKEFVEVLQELERNDVANDIISWFRQKQDRCSEEGKNWQYPRDCWIFHRHPIPRMDSKNNDNW